MIAMVGLFVISVLTFVSLTLALISFGFRKAAERLKNAQKKSDERQSVGFFHPYCNAGGGGERVLYCAIKYLQQRYSGYRFIIYTGDTDASPDQIISNAKSRFNIEFSEKIEFIYLSRRKWVEASKYRNFTMLGQSLGSVYLALEALFKFVPDVYVDTMGYAFTVPLFKYLAGSRVASYVHYPTISTDMLNRVSSRTETYNNKSSVSRSPFLTAGKLMYYRIFAKLYSWAGRCNEIIMVNSSWTEDHINFLWQSPSRTFKVYPPCDVEDLKTIPIVEDKEVKDLKIISVAQFRPEKDHPLQILTLFELRRIMKEKDWDRVKLVLIGSCRNDEDRKRVKDMEDLCKHLSVEDNVIFKVNITYEELKNELSEGIVGIHTMWNEHFGIGVVECMAAGLIMVANRSGGPMMDIVMEYDGSRNGFLATDESDYAQAIYAILSMTPESRAVIRQRARASVDRFSERQFSKEFLIATETLFTTS